MYFDDYQTNAFNMLNLQSADHRRVILQQLGSLTPFSIAVDAQFIYLSNQHPRSAMLSLFISVL